MAPFSSLRPCRAYYAPRWTLLPWGREGRDLLTCVMPFAIHIAEDIRSWVWASRVYFLEPCSDGSLLVRSARGESATIRALNDKACPRRRWEVIPQRAFAATTSIMAELESRELAKVCPID